MGLFSILCFIAIAFCVASIVVQSFGELLVLRRHRGTIEELTCVSEDDDSALVWNGAIRSEKEIAKDFQPGKPKPNNVSECAVWNSTECRAHWKEISGWEMVESTNRPMGPVFDFRWEGFREYGFDQHINKSKYQYLGKVNQSSGSAVFSFQGRHNAYVILCENEDWMKGHCFWITISTSTTVRFRIEYCGGRHPDALSASGIGCSEEVQNKHEYEGILNANEWHTFGLFWMSYKKEIRIVRFTHGHEEELIFEGRSQRWPNVSHMSVRLDKTSRVRFHFYEYLLTEKSGSVLYTDEFNWSGKEFCVELLVGLCPKCELYVNLVDNSNRNFTIGNISGDKGSVYNGTLTWRSIKFSKNITIDGQEFGGSFKLEIQAILTGDEGEGRWAMDNFRTCKPAGQQRKSTISSLSIPFDIRCQELSYNGSTIVDPWSSNKITSNTTESRRFIDKLIESCGSSCESFGKDSLLCNSMGCTCNRGYHGIDCDQTCTDGYHGYNCYEKCTPCIIGSCDKTTGLCATGCPRNTLLPPDCKKAIERPNVMKITDTTATVYQYIEFEADPNTIVDVMIQVKSSESCMNFTASLDGPERLFDYKSNLSNLSLDTIYTVHTIVSIKLANDTVSVTSPETNFATTCFTLLDFIITPGKTELNVTSKLNKVCLNDKDPDFFVRILRSADNKTAREHPNADFPALFSNLTSYTEYRVIISDTRTNMILFDEEARTLESAPSEVQNLTAILTTENETTLQWDPPLEKNGLIRNYNISLTGKLIACKGSVAGDIEPIMIPQPGNKTTLKIPGLRPYTNYTASVIAYTSESGKPKTVTFNTSETLIPTSKFSNFSLSSDNLTLHWNQPLDCTTITGPTRYAALIFESIDPDVKFKKIKQTIKPNFDCAEFHELTPYTMYRVRLYVIRDYHKFFDATNYRELTWRTPATSPPEVEDLKVYEADNNTNTISLAWKPPHPSYGEIESYQVTITDRRSVNTTNNFKVSEEGLKCELTEDYVCLKNFKIPENITQRNTYLMKIFAINKGIEEPGKIKLFRITPHIYKKKPGKPENLTWKSQSHGTIMLNWTRQMFSPMKIAEFYINVHQVSTRLTTNRTHEFSISHPAKTNHIKYSVELHLLTSTDYVVSIVAVNRRNFTSRESSISISVPGSIAYANKADLTVKQTGNCIEVQIPAVVNATDDTTVRVFVKGRMTCTNSSEPSTPLTMTEWLAAVYEPEENKIENLTIGGNYSHDVPFDCILYIGETYAIKLVATDWYPDTPSEPLSASITLHMDDDQSLESNSGWLASPPILAICLVLLLIGCRNRDRVWRQLKEPSYVEPDFVSTTTISERPNSPIYLEIIQPPSPAMSRHNSMDLYHRESSTSQLEASVEHELSDDLYSLPNEPDSCSVGIECFEEYVKDAAASGLLDSQFMLLRKDLTRPYGYGSLPENMPKNRCRYQIAYDHSRVVLGKITGDPYSDYINASYIEGYRKDRAYIAAQGPKPNTVNDFWRMIWEQRVRVICMLTNVTRDAEIATIELMGRHQIAEKRESSDKGTIYGAMFRTEWEKYWPDVGTWVVQGDFHVSNVHEQVSANYTLRIFELSHEQNTRKITHLHYTDWPNLGVPIYPQSLVEYLRKLRHTQTGNSPILVHCSAGDDRTGTVILCDICLRQAVAEKVIDVTAVITRMRDSRANMVGTLQQYILAHIIITESIVSWSTQIPTTDVLLAGIKRLKMRLPHDIQRLNDSKWQEHVLRSSATRSLLTAQEEAYLKILDLKPDRPEIIYDDVFDKDHDQINPVSVDSFKVKKQYLACSLPSPLTLANFWGFIAERDIKLIIIMQCSDPRYPTCVDIMPDESIVVPMLDIQVENETRLDEREYFTNQKLLLKDTSQDEARSQSVTVLTCKGWGCGRNQKPPPPATLISLWRASEKIPRKKGETLVLCHDGITGCGLYLALSFLLERMAVERKCNVISAVQSVRRSEREFVQSLEQFDYLYDAAVNYSECFPAYANLP